MPIAMVSLLTPSPQGLCNIDRPTGQPSVGAAAIPALAAPGTGWLSRDSARCLPMAFPPVSNTTSKVNDLFLERFWFELRLAASVLLWAFLVQLQDTIPVWKAG